MWINQLFKIGINFMINIIYIISKFLYFLILKSNKSVRCGKYIIYFYIKKIIEFIISK